MSEKIEALSSLIASVLNVSSKSIDAGSSMENTPEWDSLAQLNICLAFQEKYGVAMDMETIANATSLKKLAALTPR